MLYAWGLVANKGGDPFLPVKSGVDGDGHCPFPVKVSLPTKAPLVSVAADMGVFAVRDADGQMIAWGSSPFKGKPEVVASNVAACDVTAKGIAFVTNDGDAVMGMGPLFSLTSKPDLTVLPLPVSGSVPSKFVGVTACQQTVIGWTESGECYAMGPKVNNGVGTDALDAMVPLEIPPVASVSLGSRHGAAVTKDGRVFVWGDGKSCTLGLGKRAVVSKPTEVAEFTERGVPVVSVGCTRGQADSKRSSPTPKPGEEGARCHVVTADGKLWIAGTSHKGLLADHLNKMMDAEPDAATFYCVGGPAADAKKRDKPVPTGAAEDLTDASLAAKVAFRMGMSDVSQFGKDGVTNYLTTAKIVSSFPAHIHSLALAEDGRLFAWGCGSDGRMGLAAFMRDTGGAKRKLKCYVSTPSVIEATEDKKVLSAAVGRWWSLAIIE